VKRLLLLVALAAVGCVSDRKFVANATADRHWQDGLYRMECCVDGQPGSACVLKATAPANCPARRLALNEAKKLDTIANEAQQIGKLPKSAKKRLKAAMAKMEKP